MTSVNCNEMKQELNISIFSKHNTLMWNMDQKVSNKNSINEYDMQKCHLANTNTLTATINLI